MKSSKYRLIVHCALCIVNCTLIAPSFAFAAGHAAGIETLTIPAINFLVYIAMLYFIYRKFLKKSLAKNSQDTAEFIQRSENELIEAEREFAILNKRKSRFEDEKIGIILQHKREGEIGRERILTKAYKKAENVADAAKEQIKNELKKAEKEVQREIFEMVVSLVEDRFEIISDVDDKAMREKAVESMYNL